MVIISEKSIERIIEDVAPKVKFLTGWDPHLEGLNVKIISRSQWYEHGIKSMYERLGINTEAKTEKGKTIVKALEKIMPYLIFGQYEFLTNTILIMPENFKFGTNESGLSEILGHELVHRCQHINNQQFTKTNLYLIKKVTGPNAFDDDKEEDSSFKNCLQAYMTLIEGDAAFVQEQLKKMFYQDSKSKTPCITKFIGLLIYLVSTKENDESGLMQKAKQYSRGKKIVSKIYETEGRKGVNALYRLNRIALHRKFS